MNEKRLESDESWSGFGERSIETWFLIKEEAAETFGAPGAFFALFLQLHPGRDMYKRRIYTILDVLGDVGGLFDSLRISGIAFMMVYTVIVGNPLNAFLVNSLFKRGKGTSEIES